MFDTLKTLHKVADLAKAKVAEAEAEGAQALRHIEALVFVLTTEEKEAYEAWKTARQTAQAKG